MEKEKMVRRNEHLRKTGIWGRIILPMGMAVLIMGFLMPVFSMIWSNRTQDYTRQECEMMADALLKQKELEQRYSSESADNREQYINVLNAISGWAFAYGGTSEEELVSLYEEGMPHPDAIAFLKGEEYQTYLSDLPREEFDTVIDSAREMKDLSAIFVAPAVLVEGEGSIQYLQTELPLSGVSVVSRFPDGLGLMNGSWEGLPSLVERLLSGSVYSAVVTSMDCDTVTETFGDLSFSPGEVLDEKPDPSGILQTGDAAYVAGMAEDSDCRIYVMVPEERIPSMSILSPFFPAFLFALLFLLTILYAWFLRTDILRGRVEMERNQNGAKWMPRILLRRVRLMFVLSAVGICVLFMLVCALYVVDSSRVRGSAILSDMQGYLQESAYNTSGQTSGNVVYEEAAADKLVAVMDESPERMENQALKDLGRTLNRLLYLLNAKGKVVAASYNRYDFASLRDPDSDLAPLRGVVEGYADHVEVVARGEDYSESYVAVRDPKTKGMLLVAEMIPDSDSMEDYYADYRMPDGLILLSVDMETGKILSSSVKTYSGETASSIGLTESVCEDGYVGDVMLDGRRYLVQSKAADKGARTERTDLIASDLTCLLRQYLPVVLGTIAIGLLLVLLCLLGVFRIQKETWTRLEVKKRKEHPEEENASFYREQDGDIRSERGAVGRWLHLETPFRIMSADEKYCFVIHAVLAAALVAGYLLYQNASKAGIRGSTLSYLLQHTWRYGFNIYAVSYAVLIVTVFFVAAQLLRRLVMVIGKRFGNRGETIARLLGSFISYAAVIGSLLYGLMFLGVNTMTILASAGIVGLGISIGAKDLIADILAGISIVFEGEFRTGDIVDIDGFRGVVEEIGVRTTKVMSMENVKVFRNSAVNGVINLTQRYSIAQVKLEIRRKEPVEQMAEIFRRELPGIRKRIPKAADEIKLCGIDELKLYTIVLLFQTKCREQDRWSVESSLKWELDVLMEREGMVYWKR